MRIRISVKWPRRGWNRAAREDPFWTPPYRRRVSTNAFLLNYLLVKHHLQSRQSRKPNDEFWYFYTTGSLRAYGMGLFGRTADLPYIDPQTTFLSSFDRIFLFFNNCSNEGALANI